MNLFWEMLEDNDSFCAAVKEDNRIKYTNTNDRTIEPDYGHAADFPRVRIRFLGSKPWPYRTSNGCCDVLRWAIDVESGDRRLANTDENKIQDIKFAIYQALSTWKTYLYDFYWHGNWAGVRRLIHENTEDQIGPNATAATPLGWTTVWTGFGELWYQTSDITA